MTHNLKVHVEGFPFLFKVLTLRLLLTERRYGYALEHLALTLASVRKQCIRATGNLGPRMKNKEKSKVFILHQHSCHGCCAAFADLTSSSTTAASAPTGRSP
jgi:hypothetical protein